jgi:microtubule-associated protein-like 6
LIKITEEAFKGSLNFEIKAMHITADNKNLIVGTNGGEIYELYTKDAKLTTSSKYGNPKRIMSGHYSPNK